MINVFDAEMRLIKKEKKVKKNDSKQIKAFEIEKMQVEHNELVEALQDKLAQATNSEASTSKKHERLKANLIHKYEQLA